MNDTSDKLRRKLAELSYRQQGILVQSDFSPEGLGVAFKELLNMTFKRPSNSYIELTKYRKYVPCILYEMSNLMDDISSVREYAKREEANGKADNKHNKRWSNVEDEWLIDAVCNDEPLTRIAIALGRTPAAIQTRISYLVGVKRLSQQVEGKFIGTANGSEFEADLVGTVYKE